MKKRLLAVFLLLAMLTACAQTPIQTPPVSADPIESEPIDTAPLGSEPNDSETKPIEEPLVITDEYVLVADPADFDVAGKIRKEIIRLTGLRLWIVTDGRRQEKEIIVGDMRCNETKLLKSSLHSPFLGAAMRRGQKLVIGGGCNGASALMTDVFVAELESLLVEDKIQIPTGYRIEQGFGEELAKEVIQSISSEPSMIDETVKTETFRVFTPEGEDGWYYNHGVHLTKFKDRFYIFYYSGRIHEDDCGQRVMMATSENFEDWEIRPLVDTIQGESSELVIYPGGCYVFDGKLTVYYSAYEYRADTLRQNADGTPLRPLEENAKRIGFGRYYIQTEDGVNWSEPVKMESNPLGGTASPETLQSGTLLWAGNAKASWSEQELPDAWSNVELRLDPDTAPTPRMIESDFFLTVDGTLLMFSRTYDGVMLCAASFDDGKSWTDMYRTQFTDSDARFRFGTLPDGRYYFLGNMSYGRNELLLITSTDGIHFDQWYYLGQNHSYVRMKSGLYKGGMYGYPDLYIDEEYLYVVYSLQKESIEVMRIKLSEFHI